MRPLSASLIVTCLLLGLVGWLWQRDHARVASLEAQVAVAEQKLTQRAAVPPIAPRGTSSPTPEPPRRVGHAPESAPQRPRVITDAERQFQRQMSEYRRWSTLAKKAGVLAALKLPPEKLAPFKDLLVEREFVERDAREAAHGAGVDPRDAAAAEAAKIDARIRAVLGEVDYATYVEQTSLEVFRQQLNGTPIPGCFVDAGTPLTTGQADWLAGLMYRTFGAELTDGAMSARAADPAGLHQMFKDVVLAEAPAHLTPPQIDALRDFFRKDEKLAVFVNTQIRSQTPPK